MFSVLQVSLASKLKHENLVEMLGYCVDGNYRILAYEFATMGSLHDVLHGKTLSIQYPFHVTCAHIIFFRMSYSSVMDLHHIPLYNRKKRCSRRAAWTCTWLDAEGQNCYWGCKRYRISAWEGSAFNHPSGHQIKQCTAVWGFQGKNCRLQSFEPSTRYGSSAPFNSCIGNFWISRTWVIV